MYFAGAAIRAGTPGFSTVDRQWAVTASALGSYCRLFPAWYTGTGRHPC
jgi:hypothetical protein